VRLKRGEKKGGLALTGLPDIDSPSREKKKPLRKHYLTNKGLKTDDIWGGRGRRRLLPGKREETIIPLLRREGKVLLSMVVSSAVWGGGVTTLKSQLSSS